jgi:hypothetical protein
VADWVPTGASRGKDLVPTTVSRILRTWIVAEQILLWAALALRSHEFGWQPYWATLVLSVYQLYLLAPLMTCMRESNPAGAAATGRDPASAASVAVPALPGENA